MDRRWIALAIALIATLAYSWYTLSLPGFTDKSYFHIRQAHEILKTSTPIFNDPLSYGGSINLFVPLFDYALALVGSLIGIETAGKLLMAASFGAIVLLVYLLTRNSLAATLAAAVIPVFWHQAGSVTTTLPAIALGLFLIYAFINIEQRRWRRAYVPILMALVLVSPLAIVFMLGLVIYLILARMAGVTRVRGENELIFFSFLFNVWFLIIFFKKALVHYGAEVVWQNIPRQLLASAFSETTVLDAVVAVGIVPFIGGMYIMYRHIFTGRERTIYVIMALALTAGALVWLRLIELSLGLQLLAVTLVALLGFAVRDLISYVKRAKACWIPHACGGLVLALVLAAGIPAVNEARDAQKELISPEEQQALAWIAQHTPPGTVVLAKLEEGHAIAAIAQRPNVIDSSFLMKPDAERRLEDIAIVMTTPFESEAVRLLKQYGVSIIYWTDRARKVTGLDAPMIAADNACFPRVYQQGSVSLYGVACGLEES